MRNKIDVAFAVFILIAVFYFGLGYLSKAIGDDYIEIVFMAIIATGLISVAIYLIKKK
jgi:lipopolysaccharide export LptBFGC system permease protein LptF